MEINVFCSVVEQYYAAHARQLAWRMPDANGKFDPYKIVVSELMLQQTQVSRVSVKYAEFLHIFPSVQILSKSSLADVLVCWQGLGYNRRAKFLHQAAKEVTTTYHGRFPKTINELVKLPGIGVNTAGAIVAYAYNQPVAYVETNIRTVFLHHFFSGRDNVPDTQLMPLIEQAVANRGGLSVREWYQALMDYGTYLKSIKVKSAKRSSHYAKQSSFQGSRRQIRGGVIKALTQSPHSFVELQATLGADSRLASVLTDLLSEQLIHQNSSVYILGNGILA